MHENLLAPDERLEKLTGFIIKHGDQFELGEYRVRILRDIDTPRMSVGLEPKQADQLLSAQALGVPSVENAGFTCQYYLIIPNGTVDMAHSVTRSEKFWAIAGNHVERVNDGKPKVALLDRLLNENSNG